MRVFIPTKGRANTISSHALFPGMDVKIVVHNEAEWLEYAKNPTIRPEQILISGTPIDRGGLTRQREWVMQTQIKPGEWFLFADDNIQEIWAVPQPYYDRTMLLPMEYDTETRRRIFNTAAAGDHLQFVLQDSVDTAQQIGAQMIGFSVTSNPLWRGRKFRALGYVIGKMFLMQHNTIPFDHTITMEDFRNTAEHLLRNGAVLINNYLAPVAKHYQPGGMGTYEERIAYRQADVKKLMNLYPGLFRIKDRDGFAPGTDLALKITTSKQLHIWRTTMLRRSP